MASTKTQFTVSLVTAVNEDTAETFILYTDRELAERDRVQAANIDQAIASWIPPDTEEAKKNRPEAEKKFREDTLRTIDAATARFKADRDAALPYAQHHTFVIEKPTWGEHMKAKGRATILNENTGESRFDEDVYVLELLPISIEGMKPGDVNDMDPKIAEELRHRLLRSLFPSENRLVFTLPPPVAS